MFIYLYEINVYFDTSNHWFGIPETETDLLLNSSTNTNTNTYLKRWQISNEILNANAYAEKSTKINSDEDDLSQVENILNVSSDVESHASFPEVFCRGWRVFSI